MNFKSNSKLLSASKMDIESLLIHIYDVEDNPSISSNSFLEEYFTLYICALLSNMKTIEIREVIHRYSSSQIINGNDKLLKIINSAKEISNLVSSCNLVGLSIYATELFFSLRKEHISFADAFRREFNRSVSNIIENLFVSLETVHLSQIWNLSLEDTEKMALSLGWKCSAGYTMPSRSTNLSKPQIASLSKLQLSLIQKATTYIES